jgi:MFS superfamily sulfate permease-like transporter
MPDHDFSSAPPIGESRFAGLRHDLLPSLVVFLVALPLCMGISIASGMPVASGLITGIVGGLVVGLVSGSPLQVSGPAAGLTVIVYAIVGEHGVEMLAAAVLLAGVLQIAAGLLKLGQWFRAVAPAVVQGMLSGIGILIFANQFHVMFDEVPKATGWKNLSAIPQTIADGLEIPAKSENNPEYHRRILTEMRRASETQVRLAKQLARIGKKTDDRRVDETRRSAAAESQAVVDLLRRLRGEVVDKDWVPPRLETSEELAVLLERAETAVAKARADLVDPAVENVAPSSTAAVEALAAAVEPLKRHDFAAGIGLAAILLVAGMGQFKGAKLGMIPPQLTAIVVVTAAAALFVLPVAYVDVPDRLLSEIKLPSFDGLRSLDPKALAVAALTLAVVASAETLLCATAVDQMHSGPRTRYNQELVAQGVGNALCGALGGLPMTGVIVRSATNVEAGAKTRWSAVLHGLWLLGFVALGSSLLRLIPTSALAAVLVLTGVKLMNFKAAKELARFGGGEVAVYVATILGVVLLDLLTGVIIGIILSALKLLTEFARLETSYEPRPEPGTADLHVRGAATFLRLPALAAELEGVPSDIELHVHIDELTCIDHACFELLFNWQKRHESQGGRLVLDWERLLIVSRVVGRNGTNGPR